MVPSLFLFVFLEGRLCHPRSANHPLREKSVNEERTRRYERRIGQRGGGDLVVVDEAVDEEEARLG